MGAYSRLKFGFLANLFHSFGAVLEEFEVKDALTNALASKDTMSVEELASQFPDVQQVKGPTLYAMG